MPSRVCSLMNRYARYEPGTLMVHQGRSCAPSTLLGTAKTLAPWIAQFNQHGCPPSGLVTGSAVSQSRSPPRWRAPRSFPVYGAPRQSAHRSAGGSRDREMLAQRAWSAVTHNPTGVQPQKGEEQLDQDASSATPYARAREPSCDAHVDLSAFASGPRSELWP